MTGGSQKHAAVALFGGSFNPPGVHHRAVALGELVEPTELVAAGKPPRRGIAGEVATDEKCQARAEGGTCRDSDDTHNRTEERP